MRQYVVAVALVFSGLTAFGAEPDIVEGARRAAAYWNSRFIQCGDNQGRPAGWYAVVTEAGGECRIGSNGSGASNTIQNRRAYSGTAAQRFRVQGYDKR